MTATDTPLASILVLTYNRRDLVLALLESLQQQDYPHREFILVDNCSNDGTFEAVTRQFRDVQVLRSDANIGTAGYNLGMAKARGEYILLMDDDGLPTSSDWISRVVARLESDPKLGAVACTIRMRDSGLIAYDSPQFMPQGSATLGFPAAAYNGTGAGLRAAALRQVGFYPPDYFVSWIELHLCTRLIDAGWGVRYYPDIEVWHCRASGSVNRPNSPDGLRNYLRYVWEFYPWPDIVAETGHYLASCVMRIARGEASPSVVTRALLAAFAGWPAQSESRRPISRQTLNYLRSVRRFGNLANYREKVRPVAQE